MPKRFTDTNIWEQSWFIELSPEGKNIWTYLEKSCDCAGIWKIEVPEMRRRIGYKNINLSEFLKEVNRDYNKLTDKPIMRNRIMLIANNTKLWLTGFISFQYEKGTNGVNTNIPAIKGALNRLRDENIYDYAIKAGFVRIAGGSRNMDESEERKIDKRDLDKSKNENILSKADNNNYNKDIMSSTENINNNGSLIEEKDPSLFPINDLSLNSKGCRPFERDKDKDKDQEAIVFKDLNTEEVEKGKTEPEKAELLFIRIWSKPNKNLEEYRLVNEFINKYGFEGVEYAFREAVKYNKMTLAYVDAICRKKKEKAEKEEARERTHKLMRENEKKAEEQRKNGKCLTLIKDVYGENAENGLMKKMECG